MTLQIICFRKAAKNFSDFTNFPTSMFLFSVRKNICTAPFLDTQELHSWNTLRANVCIFLYISLRKFLFQRHSKVLPGGRWDGERLSNFFKVTRCLGLAKCFAIYHFNWNFRKFNYFLVISILLSIALKRWNFPDNLGYFSHKKSLSLNIKHYDKKTTKQTWGHSKSMSLA